jgi:flagellar biosynthetic protein FliR
MALSLDLNWVVSILLSSLRVGAVLVLTPLMTFATTPASFRILFVVAFSALLVSAPMIPPAPGMPAVDGLLLPALGELLCGAVLAFGLLAGFAAFQFAGRILDLQLGFGVAALIDPTTRTQVPLLGTLLYMAAIIAFFAIDGHHLVIRALAHSFTRFPPGSGLAAFDIGAVVTQFGLMFSFAAALAAPVMFVLLLVDVALAVMARTMPQMNVFFLSLPLKILIGLLVLVLSIRFMGPVAARLFESIVRHFERVLA